METATYEKLNHLLNRGWYEKDWYLETRLHVHALLGKEFGDTLIACLAITSANTTVKANVTLGIQAFQQYVKGSPFEGYLPSVEDNLLRYASGSPLAGPKIKAFVAALLGDEDAIVIDRWMVRAWGFKCLTSKRRAQIEEDIRWLAKARCLTPRQVQAAIWFGIKMETEEVNRDNRPFEDHLLERVHELDKAFEEVTDEV